MLEKELSKLFERDLNKLKQEISSYTNSDRLWATPEGISNSGGNLCLHLIGNLKHFVGKILGEIPYERKRENEFSDKNIPVVDLIAAIDETKTGVLNALEKINETELLKIYPVNVFGGEMTTEYFLVHLYGHLNYHLGQINYHRRLLDK